jgi:hypothetical protein
LAGKLEDFTYEDVAENLRISAQGEMVKRSRFILSAAIWK